MDPSVTSIARVARATARMVSRGLTALALASATFACSALLDAEDVDYAAAEAPVTGGEAGANAAGDADAGAVRDDADVQAPDARIGCAASACDAVGQSCCLSWLNGTDRCVDGHPATCDAGAHPSSVMACDDPTDCEARGETGLVCCLFDDSPSDAQFHSACVLPKSCTAPANRRMCLTVADCGGASCVAVPNSVYYTCAP